LLSEKNPLKSTNSAIFYSLSVLFGLMSFFGGAIRGQTPRLDFFDWLRSPIKFLLPHLKKSLVMAMAALLTAINYN
jgi:hypothetical protein